MPARERLRDRGSRLGREALAKIGRELRQARIERGLSIDEVSAAIGISNAELSRIERGLAPWVAVVTIALCGAVVGLDVTVNAYPGAEALRDAGHASLLAAFRAALHPSVGWAVEVPLPIPGDQRAWDGMAARATWRYGVEAETAPRDAQALIRRVRLKERDGRVDGVLLVLRDSRRTRHFVREAADELAAAFPVPGAVALARLRSGEDPGGSAVILVARSGNRGEVAVA